MTLLVSALFLASCGQEKHEFAAGEDQVVLVEVDGVPITLGMLERAMEGQGVEADDHERMSAVFDELVGIQAVANAARREGVDRQARVQAALRLAEIRTLYANYISTALADDGLTEQDARDIYEQQRKLSGDNQYRIAIVGYPSQGRALQALDAIEEGQLDYEELQQKAGEENLPVDEPGWIDQSQVPEDFALQIKDTAAGDVVPVPLGDGRAWYVVRVLETRALQPPPFEQVREGIMQSLRQQQRQALTETLVEEANIKPMLPLEDAPVAGNDG
ncbi:MAG TPA: peptidylprolyl isomerase [Wenzhouxiangella sp.]|nr:peptidylprolyl isomerase [Wenzhouxiangella sp.]